MKRLKEKLKAIPGGIYKSYRDSFFLKFHLDSPLSKVLLSDLPSYHGSKIVVLQIIICDDMVVVAEIINIEKFDHELTQQQ